MVALPLSLGLPGSQLLRLPVLLRLQGLDLPLPRQLLLQQWQQQQHKTSLILLHLLLVLGTAQLCTQGSGHRKTASAAAAHLGVRQMAWALSSRRTLNSALLVGFTFVLSF